MSKRMSFVLFCLYFVLLCCDTITNSANYQYIDSFNNKNTRIIYETKQNGVWYSIESYDNSKLMTISDEDVKQIVSLLKKGNIDFLFLNSKKLTKKGLIDFANNFMINRIHVEVSQINSNEFSEFLGVLLEKSKPSLLIINNCQIDRKIFELIRVSKSLTSLRYFRNSYKIANNDLEVISQNQHLKTLIISNQAVEF